MDDYVEEIVDLRRREIETTCEEFRKQFPFDLHAPHGIAISDDGVLSILTSHSFEGDLCDFCYAEIGMCHEQVGDAIQSHSILWGMAWCGDCFSLLSGCDVPDYLEKRLQQRREEVRADVQTLRACLGDNFSRVSELVASGAGEGGLRLSDFAGVELVNRKAADWSCHLCYRGKEICAPTKPDLTKVGDLCAKIYFYPCTHVCRECLEVLVDAVNCHLKPAKS